MTNVSFAQTIDVNEKGIKNLHISTNIKNITYFEVKPIDEHQFVKRIRMMHREKFNYYFINSSSDLKTNIGLATDIFIATDNNDSINTIFIFLDDILENYNEVLDNIFDKEKYESKSGIGNNYSAIQKLWSKNGINILLRKNENPIQTKIYISKTTNNLSDDKPYINFASSR